MKEYIVEKLEKSFGECDKHFNRMSSAYIKIAPILPLNAQKYVNLRDDEISYIDQYLFRFSKLQDTMGEKLFKTVLLFLDEEIDGKPFVDLLNRMEKLSIIDSAQQWRALRDIRNELSHQYDDDPEDMSIALNKIFQEKSSIETIYNQIKQYCNDKKTGRR
jgi:hypothetical protein